MNFNEAIVIDLETTGLVSSVSEIIEIGMLHIRFNEDYSYEVLSKFHSLIQPMKKGLINPKAMKKNGIQKDELFKARLPQEIRGDLFEWWEDCLGGQVCDIIGHNFQGFDKSFLQLFLGEAYAKMFDYHAEDTWAFARGLQRIGLIPIDTNLSLEPLSEYLGIPIKAHRALDDCYATINVYTALLNLANGKSIPSMEE